MSWPATGGLGWGCWDLGKAQPKSNLVHVTSCGKNFNYFFLNLLISFSAEHSLNCSLTHRGARVWGHLHLRSATFAVYLGPRLGRVSLQAPGTFNSLILYIQIFYGMLMLHLPMSVIGPEYNQLHYYYQ